MLRKTALAVTTALVLGASNATAAVFGLTGITDSGPLSGLVFSGQFGYDETSFGAGFTGSVVLNNFDLEFVGESFTLASADIAPTADFADGVFLGLSYLDADSSDAMLRPHVSLISGFTGFDQSYLAYETGPGAGGFGGYAVTPIPEASAPAMLIAGLAVLGALVRRRRAEAGPSAG